MLLVLRLFAFALHLRTQMIARKGMVVVVGCTSWEYCPLIIWNLGLTAAAAISRNWGIGQIYAAAIRTMTRTLIILIIRVVND